jgi:hypothetical protein
MTLGIANDFHRRPKLIGLLLVSLLAAGLVIWHRFRSSENGKTGLQLAIAHGIDDRDIVERVKYAWRLVRKMTADFHPPRKL